MAYYGNLRDTVRVEDDEASLRLALQLHEEMNGDIALPVTKTAPKSFVTIVPHGDDCDADLAYAMQLSAELNGGQASATLQTFEPPNYGPPLDSPGFSSTSNASIRGVAGYEGGKLHPYHDEHRSNSTSTSRTFTTFNEFASHVRTRKCALCNTKLINGQQDIEELFKSWLNGKSAASSRVKCKRCSTSTCVGCNSKPSGKNFPTQTNVQGTQLSWCCSHGRLFLVWVTLCGMDQQYCSEKLREAAKTGTRRVGSSSYSHHDTGIGYGGGRPGEDLAYANSMKPIMYTSGPGHQFLQPKPAQDAGKMKAQNAQQVSDSFIHMVLGFLVELLPSLDRQSSFDMDPPEAVVSMLLNSKILNKAAELLRNDSLEDATKRKDLYQALLNFLRAIGNHHVTASKTMFSERVLRPDTVNLLTLSFGGNPGSGKAKEDTSSSLGDCLRNLNLQSNMMLQGAQLNEKEFRNQEGQDMLWLCRQVSDLSEYLLVNTKAGSGAVSKNQEAENINHCIVEVPDQQIFANYHYAATARAITQSPPGRMKRLITEITTLTTGLPPGIFVKYAASRLDVMKIIIVGPVGTPYENGLFEFDLLCTGNFPFESPKVTFRTTGGGTVCFNPNLYADGKVCLSLLGTWQGEPWRPAQSTILQVLVSIQAMILCDEPYCNEPSNETYRGRPESKAFNKTIEGFTVRYAIMDWLQSAHPVWNDVVASHFKKNAQAILQTVLRWEQHGLGVHPPRGWVGMVGPGQGKARAEVVSTLRPQLEMLLQKFGANPVAGHTASPKALSPSHGGNRHPPGYGSQSPGRGGYGLGSFGGRHGMPGGYY
ncbi:uncharacterized protein BDR25DRAFT_395341 [Lindgomyces ingoldianus]|uniref:Uncharacterized protein n=1 Tax=Lindgomyces ingoldianus TaxID=673940 RepID=A0ACB6QM21_9PLEO|nr:uncharacterized protein BDR25DRAFT_395341 [Lindgomyces ingoldianus]KAF2467196.1 hypothetical protein BDR25DRAFT_395341 [Lindgomyces ingoldianus]